MRIKLDYYTKNSLDTPILKWYNSQNEFGKD